MFRVKFPLDRMTQEVLAVRGTLRQKRTDLMTLLGTQVLTFAQQDYRKKARGQRGSDGITWAKLSRRTLKARVMRRSQGKAIVAQRRQLAEQIEKLLGKEQRKAKKSKPIRTRKRTTSKRTRKERSPTKRLQTRLKRMPKGKRTGNKQQQIQALRKKRLELLAKLEGLVDREMSKYEIGVDTGLQRSSASPGFRGPDGKGGNLFTAQQNRVTVGYQRNYSGYFDEKRKLLPDRLPDEWRRKLEAVTTRWANKAAREASGGS